MKRPGTVLRSLLVSGLLLLAAPPLAMAQFEKKELVVARGKEVLFRGFAQYQTARGCTPGPEGMFDVDPKPKLGTIVSRTIVRRGRGACGLADYPSQYIYFRAGNTPGVEEFTFFLYPSAFFGGTAWRYPLKIIVK